MTQQFFGVLLTTVNESTLWNFFDSAQDKTTSLNTSVVDAEACSNKVW